MLNSSFLMPGCLFSAMKPLARLISYYEAGSYPNPYRKQCILPKSEPTYTTPRGDQRRQLPPGATMSIP